MGRAGEERNDQVESVNVAVQTTRSPWWRGVPRRVRSFIAGRPEALPPALVARYPELAGARWRRGGLALRVGGWCLGQSTVAGITLWRTVFLAEHVGVPEPLLLHELAHVQQFGQVRGFAVRYCWESIRHGYRGNRFEREADAFADRLLFERAPTGRRTPGESGRSP